MLKRTASVEPHVLRLLLETDESSWDIAECKYSLTTESIPSPQTFGNDHLARCAYAAPVKTLWPAARLNRPNTSLLVKQSHFQASTLGSAAEECSLGAEIAHSRGLGEIA